MKIFLNKWKTAKVHVKKDGGLQKSRFNSFLFEFLALFLHSLSVLYKMYQSLVSKKNMLLENVAQRLEYWPVTPKVVGSNPIILAHFQTLHFEEMWKSSIL